MRGRGVWPAAVLLAVAATAREVVRLGYFTEAQPFEVACARGWFEGELCENVGFKCRGPPGSGDVDAYCYDSNDVAFDCTCDFEAFVPSSTKKNSRDKEWLMPLAYTCAVVAGLS